MRKVITAIFIFIFFVSDAFGAKLVASDVDPSSLFEQISLIVSVIVSFLTFLMGSRRVLKFIG